ncbi:HAD-IC family P-type ATPase [Companilactobacillus metriopterae]|uniref:HAD-IC family P-type ATPase n=1 Tax=Companilactobacillus metriopterae TaxID=1909267 RepID=UPI00100A2FDD|nr:HAD-IC family P-type ATPase [Companilactobacillus metriopterae]
MSEIQNKITPTDLRTGLTTDQVKQKIQDGQTNVQIKNVSRSIPRIIGDNVFTLFNFLNLFIAVLIFWTGSYKNLLFLGPVLANILIGSFQEIRAKITVDKINLVHKQMYDVIRDGKQIQTSIELLVKDDLVLLRRGDTIPADGIIRTTNGFQVNESSITGESNSIIKQIDQEVFSGSFAIAGNATIQLTKVGHDSFVSKISSAVGKEKRETSVLMKMINRIIKVLTYTIIPLGLILFIRTFVKNGDIAQSIISTSASVIGMIPEGLVLLTSIALATAAYNLTRKKIIVRSLSAIETLARVDTLCLDKTGTITTGNLKVTKLKTFNNYSEIELKQIATKIIEVTDETNATAAAIKKLKSETSSIISTESIPFSSETKLSGFETSPTQRYIMGAPEFIIKNMDSDLKSEIEQYTSDGLRVIAVLYENNDIQDLLGLIMIADEVRKSATSTFNYLVNQGINLKIISGDNPVTVSNVAKQAKIKGSEKYIDMSSVTDEDYHDLVKDYQVFGRVKPDQKADLISAMQDNGLTVGMTGDGVNDVLAMRKSDCSIAIAGESEAAEASADFVLLNKNFDSMIFMLNEGRRVINNVERVASLYLIKTIYSVVLTLIFIAIGTGYPFQPAQLTPINALTVGIPSFILALEPNYTPPAGRFMRNVLEIALPAALCNIILITLISTVGRHIGLYSLTTSTLSVFTIGIIGYCALLAISTPLTNRKKTMIGLSMILFLVTFTFGNRIFNLQSITDLAYTFLFISLSLIAWPLFVFMRETLGRRVFSRIKL